MDVDEQLERLRELNKLVTIAIDLLSDPNQPWRLCEQEQYDFILGGKFGITYFPYARSATPSNQINH